jgi:uncharacterized membrane protein
MSSKSDTKYEASLEDGDIVFEDYYKKETRKLQFNPTITKENVIISGTTFLIGLYYMNPLIMNLALLAAIVSAVSNGLYVEFESHEKKQENEDMKIENLKEKYANGELSDDEFEDKLEKAILNE